MISKTAMIREEMQEIVNEILKLQKEFEMRREHKILDRIIKLHNECAVLEKEFWGMQ